MTALALAPALTLTTRQLALLALVCRGWGNRRIARHIGRGESTVKRELMSCYATLGVGHCGDQRTRAAVLAWAALRDMARQRAEREAA